MKRDPEKNGKCDSLLKLRLMSFKIVKYILYYVCIKSFLIS